MYSLNQIKKELQSLPHSEMLELCLKLAKFQKANKEVIAYLLFESSNPEQFIETQKEWVSNAFATSYWNTYYMTKKHLRKILSHIAKQSKISGSVFVEIELRYLVIKKMEEFKLADPNYLVVWNIYQRQKMLIAKKIEKLHEDYQMDYNYMLEDK
jgi:membrane-anchored protein YejM (alkaline phosphatase superfamily)